MPWDTFKRGDEWCVFKTDADGEPVGDTLGCHDTEAGAQAQVAALFANENNVAELDNSLDDQVSAVRMAFERAYMQPGQPGPSYLWVTDVFPDSVIVRNDTSMWRVGYERNKEDVITFDDRPNWVPVRATYEVITEMSERTEPETIQAVIVSEFKGGFPAVTPAPGVDLNALIVGDDDPMFLTVPISRIGEVSRNGLVHDRAFAESLVKQVNTDRPGGLMGHLRDEDRTTAYPTSSIHWLGAALVGDTVWAKGYIPRTKPEVREEIRVAKAKGGRVATSVYGKAVKELANGGSQWRATDFDLESIDLAPYKRAALPGSGEFVITSEMAPSVRTPERKGNTTMDKTALIAELTVKDLPETLKAAVLKEYEAANRVQAQVAELTGERDGLRETIVELTKERDGLAQRIRELEELEVKRVAEQEAREFDLALTALVSEHLNWDGTEEANQKRDLLRRQFRRAIISELGDTHDAEKVKEVTNRLWEEEYQILAETLRDALAGPGAIVPGKRPPTITVDDSPEAIAAARAKFGF